MAKGDMELVVLERGQFRTVTIRQGQVGAFSSSVRRSVPFETRVPCGVPGVSAAGQDSALAAEAGRHHRPRRRKGTPGPRVRLPQVV